MVKGKSRRCLVEFYSFIAYNNVRVFLVRFVRNDDGDDDYGC